MSLKSIIELIIKAHPDQTAGQLAVYRVFMGMDTQLLRRNGINTLRFKEDRLITDPELQRAIVENMRKHLGIECPQSVFLS